MCKFLFKVILIILNGQCRLASYKHSAGLCTLQASLSHSHLFSFRRSNQFPVGMDMKHILLPIQWVALSTGGGVNWPGHET
jgi:hypothetical protein